MNQSSTQRMGERVYQHNLLVNVPSFSAKYSFLKDGHGFQLEQSVFYISFIYKNKMTMS